jgi:heme oxygenase (biliverdin-producing, ferredoxin)
MTSMCNEAVPGLAQRLRSDTKELHRRAEQTGIIRALFSGTLRRHAYCTLLRNLYEIYAALESALDRRASHPCVAPLCFPELARKQALLLDLRALHGVKWERALEVALPTLQYVRRLREIEASQPALLCAHGYVRYLGDLSGGQLMRERISRAFALGDGEGTRFFQFAGPGAAADWSRRYRAALDVLPLNRQTADDVVEEAKQSFLLHIRLFEALEVNASDRANSAGAN